MTDAAGTSPSIVISRALTVPWPRRRGVPGRASTLCRSRIVEGFSRRTRSAWSSHAAASSSKVQPGPLAGGIELGATGVLVLTRSDRLGHPDVRAAGVEEVRLDPPASLALESSGRGPA